MAKAQFKRMVKTNARETSRFLKGELTGGDKGLGADLAAFTADSMSVMYPPFLYSETGEATPDKPNAQFTIKVLEDSKKAFGGKTGTKAGKHGFKSCEKTSSGTYIFKWISLGSAEGQKFVEGQSRRHINSLYKDMGKKKRSGDDELVGGHIQSSALLQRLRKGVAFGLITTEEAKAYLTKYRTGGQEGSLTPGGEDRFGARDTSAKGDIGSGGFLEQDYSREAFGIKYGMDKEISEFHSDYGLYEEVMLPIPKGMNKKQEKHYEDHAQKVVGAHLKNLADEKLYNDPTSPSMEKMHQEIIAAALLGKKVPKYKVNHKFNNRSPAKRKVTKHRLERSKKSATKGAKAKFMSQLRTAQGQFASPTSLMNLINSKLNREITDNMGHPALENQTGKFANSVRVIKVNRNKKLPTIQYTYDTDPYQVFEMGGRGDSRWATGARDPRVLIDKTIREIAAEMMVTRFATQRL